MLIPRTINPQDKSFQDILLWQFPDEPFYVAQITQLLNIDIPKRMVTNSCDLWGFEDSSSEIVGFASLENSIEYPQYTSHKKHLYIPVLAVNPQHQGLGYGHEIVQFLLDMADATPRVGMSNGLFLDVYTANFKAVTLYQKHGFTILNPDEPLLDPNENDEPYYIMAKVLT